jgi:hypothetical protein
MTDVEKIIGRFSLLLPIVHIITCGLFMAGYSLGFGGNIGGLFSASDFFTITIQHLITTYTLSLMAPILFILSRHRTGRAYAIDLINAEKDEETRARLVSTRQFIVKLTSWVLPLFAILFVVMACLSIYADAHVEYYLTLNMLVLGFLPTWWNLMNRLKLGGLPVEIAWCAIAFAVGVVGLGLNIGQTDRRLPYTALTESRMRCSNQVILSPIGERFLSVTPDNRRHIINEDCKTQFDFQKTAVFVPGSLYDLVRKKWQSSKGAEAAAAAPANDRAPAKPTPLPSSERN